MNEGHVHLQLSIGALCLVLVYQTGCARPLGQGEQKHSPQRVIRIVTPLSHPSLDETIRGFLDGLAESGFSRSELNLRPDSGTPALNANGDFSAIESVLKAAISDKPEVLFVLTTPAATQAAPLALQAHIPLVYAAVTDPVKARIVTAMSGSTTPATGVSDLYPVDRQVKLFTQISPTMKAAAILLNPKEENSRILADLTASELKKRGVATKRYDVNGTSDIAPRAESAAIESDALIVNGDNLIIQNLGIVVNVSIKHKKPLFVGDTDSVKKGAVGTVGPSYYGMGRQAGKKAGAILNGQTAGSIPSDTPLDFDYIINTQAAEAMGVVIPREIWSQRSIWQSPASVTQR